MRFWASVSLGFVPGVVTFAQAPSQTKSAGVKPRRFNELTLAELRPGRDFAKRAMDLYRYQPAKDSGTQLTWTDPCRTERLTLDTDAEKRIQVVKVEEQDIHGTVDCKDRLPLSRWKTGRGLRFWDPAPRVIQLYGEPDSRSPSTKGGRKLELLYYAFDWAGSDVPQVMEVLCTVEDDGKPGRVVEITLAAPSL
jgi:hypothetical protein